VSEEDILRKNRREQVKDEMANAAGLWDLLKKMDGERWRCYISYLVEVIFIILVILCLLVGAGAGFAWMLTEVF